MKVFKNNLGKNHKGVAMALGFTALGIMSCFVLVMGVTTCL